MSFDHSSPSPNSNSGGETKRPSLAERLRGKSPFKNFNSDNFVDDLKKELDKERKMFFDEDFGNSFPSRISRGGFPFSSGVGSSGSSPHSSVFDDIRQRPMFAQMRRPQWNDFGGPEFRHHQQTGRERHNSGGGASSCSSAASGSSAGSGGSDGNTTEHVIPIRVINTTSNHHDGQEEPKQKKYTQSNTTEIPLRSSAPEVVEGRGVRAQSAPPGSREDLKTPLSNKRSEGGEAQPPIHEFGGNSSKNPPQSPTASGSVRRIPIFVEERNSNVYHQDTVDGVGRSKSPAPVPSPQKSSRPAEHSPTPPPKKPSPAKDPIEKVMVISDDVKALEKEVDVFVGNSKKDKGYLFLDEMLTRNLIKLDDIETEGREDVRMARKDCIKLIQSCISKLEAKVDGRNEVDQKAGQTQSPNNMEIVLVTPPALLPIEGNNENLMKDTPMDMGANNPPEAAKK